jgi:alpha-glucoside transport system permease protein
MNKGRFQKFSRSFLVNGILTLIVLCWLIPVLGIFVSSFRQRFDIQTSPWWYVLPHQGWVMTKTINPREIGLDANGPMKVEGVTATFEEMRAGVEEGNTRLVWIGNRRIGKIEIQKKAWVTSAGLTLDNYQQVILGKNINITHADGTVETVRGDDFSGALLNSLTVSIPSTIIPILIAAFAAYGFAWMNFPGRRFWFIVVVALLVVPLQIALVPVLRDFAGLDLNGTFLGIWMAHTGFGLPLATYLLFNYISTLPRETLEAAFIDGASHFTIFTKLILPLSVPRWRIFRDLPVPLGLERLSGGFDHFGPRSERAGGDHETGIHRRRPRPGLAFADSRCLRQHAHPVDRVLRPAALLRARYARRLCQRLMSGL